MHAETDLVALLRRLSPHLREGAYVYTIVSDAIPPGAVPVVVVREDEGLTLVLPQQQADDLGLSLRLRRRLDHPAGSFSPRRRRLDGGGQPSPD